MLISMRTSVAGDLRGLTRVLAPDIADGTRGNKDKAGLGGDKRLTDEVDKVVLS